MEREITKGSFRDGANLPRSISHYLVEDCLGRGAFGVVYAAFDTRLERPVAVKVLQGSTDGGFGRGEVLEEARMLAQLDHPNIVPVYDVGLENGEPYLVSKRVEGQTLEAWMKRSEGVEFVEVASMLAVVARALAHAHRKGLVHRDVKPRNILVDTGGSPHLIDFGVALVRENMGRGRGGYVGTPPYMSPEQARGEAHLVDGRADVFALGVILYQFLTGEQPFEGDTEELLHEIESGDVVPPSQICATVPRELERICLSALARLPGERTASAAILAEELEEFADRSGVRAEAADAAIVPKGLHSFEEEDASFFLQLLPGPKDREGVPASLRFWQNRIEATDPNESFRVGLIYGPSGCGKSSLVKGGLLPLLTPSVISVFVEAEGETGEAVVNALHRRFPRLDGERDLAGLLRKLRQGKIVPLGTKVLLVIDQFEQHLHGRKSNDTSLERALRQCDGEKVSALLVVRDDFWTEVSETFGLLELGIDTGRNAAVVDLFDRRHAERVLTLFGRSLGALPPEPIALARAQGRFVKRAVQLLMGEGEKVVPVRLALFAEMLKGRTWVPGELQSVGGLSGLGVLFLEECFGERSTSGEAKRLAPAARCVLGELVPTGNSEIKGEARSRSELARAADVADEDLEILLGLLGKEFHLLKPAANSGEEGCRGEQRFALAHDYMVPSVRRWLDSKRMETRSGRAEIRLRDSVERWTVTKNPRLLPSVREWLQIRLFGARESWDSSSREMMNRAGRRIGMKAAVVGAAVALLVGAVWHSRQELAAEDLYNQIFVTRLDRLGSLRPEVERMRRLVEPKLQDLLEAEDAGEQEMLAARVVLSWSHETELERLAEHFLEVTPVDFGYLLAAIGDEIEPLVARMERIAVEQGENELGFRAKLFLSVAADFGRYGDQFLGLYFQMHPELIADWIPAIDGSDGIRAALEVGQIPAPMRAKEWGELARARCRAKMALAELLLGDRHRVMGLLGTLEDLDTRSYLIEMLRPSVIDHETFARLLGSAGDPYSLAGLLQAVPQFGSGSMSQEAWQSVQMYVAHKTLAADPYVKSSADYARDNDAVQEPRRRGSERYEPVPSPKLWHENSQGDVYVVLPDSVGGRRIAMAQTELTIGSYQAYLPLPVVPEEDEKLSPYPDGPVLHVTPASIFEFCVLLSEAEGLEPCFFERAGQWFVYADYHNRSGYRPATDEEWTYASKAGSDSVHYFGNGTDLIHRYAWLRANSGGAAQKVASRIPNQFGLFDMLGNAAEWTMPEWSELPASEQFFPMQLGGFTVGEHYFSSNTMQEFKGNSQLRAGYRLVKTLGASWQGRVTNRRADFSNE